MSWKLGAHAVSVVFLLAVSAQAAKMEIVPTHASGPHLINGRDITIVGGGEEVTLEIRVSDWEPYLLRTFQATVDMAGFVSGDAGTALPLGWDRAWDPLFCGGGVCPLEWPVCYEVPTICVGPDYEPYAGAFIDTANPDYVFYGIADLNGIDHVDYRFGSTVLNPSAYPSYTPPAKYCATLVLVVSEDAAGTFTIGLVGDSFASFMMDPRFVQMHPEFYSATITIVDPGCGNGICELGETHTSCPDDCDRDVRVRELDPRVKSVPAGEDEAKPARRLRSSDAE